MPDRPVQTDPVDEPQLPAGLVEALGGLYRAGPEVPAGIDRAILAGARAGYLRRRRFWLAARAVGATAAAAAAIAIAVVAYRDRGRSASAPVATTQGGARAAARGDVDGNGRVDILDAFLLARKVQAGAATADDVNGDGVVDRRDVDAVARIAVRVDAGAADAKGGVR
jgi:hypothetical protein